MSDQPLKKKRRWLPITLIFVGGILTAGLVNSALDYTNRTEFCVSCHTMQTNFKELQETVHWSSASGVHAGCADCHVPKAFFPKMKAKILAAKDVYHEIVGTIDTPEKYEARRWQMANAVWDKMRASDSRECRSCHSVDHMDFEEQDKSAAKKHSQMVERGQTCIDCHQGIAHKEPDEPKDAKTN